MFGQLGFPCKLAGCEYEDKQPLERYQKGSKRLLGVLEQRLEGRDWIMGAEYTIPDISLLGWVNTMIGFYGERKLAEFYRFPVVDQWLSRGLNIPQ